MAEIHYLDRLGLQDGFLSSFPLCVCGVNRPGCWSLLSPSLQSDLGPFVGGHGVAVLSFLRCVSDGFLRGPQVAALFPSFLLQASCAR